MQIIPKKIPNISHIPRNLDDLNNILTFLVKPKERGVFYDFLRSSSIIKSKKSALINGKEDSTERKWKNHLTRIGILHESQSKILLTESSLKYIKGNMKIRDYILDTVHTSVEFNNVFNDLKQVSFYSNKYESISDLYKILKEELHYVSRSVSAERNLSGMINYLKIGNVIDRKKGEIILIDKNFVQEKEVNELRKMSIEFVKLNSIYGGYTSIKELLKYLKSKTSHTKHEIEFLIKRFLNEKEVFSYQEASSNKEIGVFVGSKNILFIRNKYEKE